jgi:nucleoside-diphosphate-sugar epimerase
MRILVIGGTRFMGLQAVQRLVADGHEITVFHRGNLCGALPEAVEHLHGDAKELSRFTGEMKRIRPDAVLDMVLERGADAAELVKAVSSSTGKLVAASSANVYLGYSLLHRLETAEPEDRVYTEAGPLRNHRFSAADNHDEKIEVEQVVMDAASLSPTVIRMKAVHGPNDPQHRGYELLWRMDAGRPYIVLNDVVGRWKWGRGYVDNVVDALLLTLFDDRAAGKIYNVGDPLTMTQAEWVEALGKAAGWSGRVITTSARPASEDTDFRHHVVVDTSLIREELGYSESVPADEWIRRTVEWLRANPPSPDEAARIKAAGLGFEEEDRIVAEIE